MQNVEMRRLTCQSKLPTGSNGRRNRRSVGAPTVREKDRRKKKPYRGPSKFTLASKKGEIELEGNTKFPTELAGEHANEEEDKRRSQIKPKENMDEVGERLCTW